MKVLSILETAYRGTLEEQDDAAIWITGALRKAGMDIDVLVRGNAVNYAVRGQDPTGIAIGDVEIDRPAHLDKDLLALQDDGAGVQIVREDLLDRGVSLDNVVPQFELVGRAKLGDLISQYDQVWYW